MTPKERTAGGPFVCFFEFSDLNFAVSNRRSLLHLVLCNGGRVRKTQMRGEFCQCHDHDHQLGKVSIACPLGMLIYRCPYAWQPPSLK